MDFRCFFRVWQLRCKPSCQWRLHRACSDVSSTWATRLELFEGVGERRSRRRRFVLFLCWVSAMAPTTAGWYPSIRISLRLAALSISLLSGSWFSEVFLRRIFFGVRISRLILRYGRLERFSHWPLYVTALYYIYMYVCILRPFFIVRIRVLCHSIYFLFQILCNRWTMAPVFRYSGFAIIFIRSCPMFPSLYLDLKFFRLCECFLCKLPLIQFNAIFWSALLIYSYICSFLSMPLLVILVFTVSDFAKRPLAKDLLWYRFVCM